MEQRTAPCRSPRTYDGKTWTDCRCIGCARLRAAALAARYPIHSADPLYLPRHSTSRDCGRGEKRKT